MKNASSMSESKRMSGIRAASLVESGQRVGLGTGSTAAFAIEELGRRAREEGLSILCAVTSYQTLFLARRHGLTVHPLELFDALDLSIDGADEIDPALNLIKGGGGAHTLEKIVHAMSRRFIVVADSTKRVEHLGAAFPVPLEVIPSAVSFVQKRLLDFGAREMDLRSGGKKDGPVITDNGNFVLDAKFEIKDAVELEQALNSIPGVVENGIFSSLSVRVDRVLIGTSDGVEEISP